MLRNKIFFIVLIAASITTLGYGVNVAKASENISPVSNKSYNRLIHEKSPYLLQHAHNPIHWYAWGEEALKAARDQDKPIFLSVGYSTCHWCHVLEKESFENQEIADVLNEGYISIKVDREENPDVDQFYMQAVQAMTGNGGWPMTVVMSPDKMPFFAGTYFPRVQLMKILTTLSSAWLSERGKIKSIGENIGKFLKASKNISAGSIVLDEYILKSFYGKAVQSFDSKFGGFGTSIKFPPPMKLALLLRIAHRTGDKKALEIVDTTLKKMAQGGIYDHLGGGFHRYATDRHWGVPHFEKMLYNQASLSLIYLESFQVFKTPMYESVARGILDYVLRDMTGPEGGFYSAEDADSEGAEGIYYVWSESELKNHLTQEEYEHFKNIYSISTGGNFSESGKFVNVLNLKNNIDWEIKSTPSSKTIHQRLLKIREKRIHPFKDDKVLTAWNGMMLCSMAKAYQVLGDIKYLEAAQNSARFIKDKLYIDGRLARRFRDGNVKGQATLDDYAYLIQGLITLYEADFDEVWLRWAIELQTSQDKIFWDTDDGGYFFAEEKGNFLPIRKKNFDDNARPNSNAVSALNLLYLYNYTFEKTYREKARKIFEVAGELMVKFPLGYTQTLIALDFYLDKTKEVAIVGSPDSPEKAAILKMLQSKFIPSKSLAYLNPEKTSTLAILEDKVTGEKTTTVYVCENNVCKYPSSDINKIQKLVSENKRYKLN
ncbi:MAG: thioredoxin domain-containing protein [Nitrospinales bacterium]